MVDDEAKLVDRREQAEGRRRADGGVAGLQVREPLPQKICESIRLQDHLLELRLADRTLSHRLAEGGERGCACELCHDHGAFHFRSRIA